MRSFSTIQSKIFTIRGIQVMLDFDLADLYSVDTKRINEQVKRNIERFPDDFMFRLTLDEFEILRSQSAASNLSKRRNTPFAFTQNGVAMLSSVLNSTEAIEINIQIMRVFVKIKELSVEYSKHISELYKMIREVDTKHDSRYSDIISYLSEILEKGDTNELRKIGFFNDNE